MGCHYVYTSNDYMDIKTVMDFFDKEGIKLNQKLKYKKQAGDKKATTEKKTPEKK